MKATLITRDPSPIWKPADLGEVTDEEVRGEGGKEGKSFFLFF